MPPESRNEYGAHDCLTGEPGSRADSWILRQTTLYQHYDQFFPTRAHFQGYAPFYYLFGDSGFQLLEWLMTPFSAKQENDMRKDASTRARHKMYSRDQKSTRACIERAFGVLKSRWLCLRDGLQCMHIHTVTTVLACIVLHNACIAQHDLWAEYDPVLDADEDGGLEAPNWLEVDPTAPVPTPANSNEKAPRSRANRERLTLILRNNRRDDTP